MKLQNDVREQMIQWLREFINDHCIHRVKPGEPTMRPLHPSHAPEGYTWLILSRRGMLNGFFASYVGMLFWDLFAEKYKERPFQITGLETACIPIITSIAMTSRSFGIENLNCFYIRKEPKDYGLLQTFEGYMLNDRPALIVDDFYNSRSTYLTARKFLEQNNIEVYKQAFAIINKQWELYDNNEDDFRARTRAAIEDIDIVSLFNITDFDLSYNKYNLNKAKRNANVVY